MVVKGGATSSGAAAASSHTGALAADDAVFDGACRQAGITRAATIEEAYEAAATFATQPLPKGPRVAVYTTAGGWGVVTADAIARSSLELLALPDDLKAEIDQHLPPRWSRNNPIDLAGSETRDTIPQVMEIVVNHRDVDAVIFLGLGIQSNLARMEREGRFYPDHGLERIVEYHERQDARFAQAAAELSEASGKPILTATELAVSDPDQRRSGRRPGHGSPLLRLLQPGGHRPRPPLALRPLPPTPGALTDSCAGSPSPCCWWSSPWAAAIGAVYADTGGETAEAAVDIESPVTPVLSARRVPEHITEDIADRRLTTALTGLVDGAPPDTCLVVDAGGPADHRPPGRARG